MLKRYETEFRKSEELEREELFYRILECTLNLSFQESQVYLALQNHPYTGLNELAEFTNKNVSGLNRILKSLMEKGLVMREYRILKHGGYKYFYYPVPLEELVPGIREMIRGWIMELDSMVESFSLKIREKSGLHLEVEFGAGRDNVTSLQLR